jgi:hypothetical protein
MKDLIKEAKQYQTCMALTVNEEGDAGELYLDTSIATYGEWIKGEGADIYLLKSMETGKVVGCRLPLLNDKLVVHHNGPLRVNEGFRREEQDACLD